MRQASKKEHHIALKTRETMLIVVKALQMRGSASTGKGYSS